MIALANSPRFLDRLRHLAVDQKVAASTQNQALHARVFLFREVLGWDSGDFSDVRPAKQPRRLIASDPWAAPASKLLPFGLLSPTPQSTLI
jgi:hypothetical protein